MLLYLSFINKPLKLTLNVLVMQWVQAMACSRARPAPLLTHRHEAFSLCRLQHSILRAAGHCSCASHVLGPLSLRQAACLRLFALPRLRQRTLWGGWTETRHAGSFQHSLALRHAACLSLCAPCRLWQSTQWGGWTSLPRRRSPTSSGASPRWTSTTTSSLRPPAPTSNVRLSQAPNSRMPVCIRQS